MSLKMCNTVRKKKKISAVRHYAAADNLQQSRVGEIESIPDLVIK